jgi:hypothetical protein
MAGTVKDVDSQVVARKYMAQKHRELDGKVGTVRSVSDGGVIVVDFGGDVGTRELRASHIMLHRENGNGKGGSKTGGNPQAETSDQSGTAEGSAQNALNPDAQEITDADVRQLRGQTPSRRGQLIAHLLDPADPEFGGKEGHDHGLQERSESTIRKATSDDLEAWHRNAHKDSTPDGPSHP